MKFLYISVLVIMTGLFMWSCNQDNATILSSTESESLEKQAVSKTEDAFLSKKDNNFRSHQNGADAGTDSRAQGQAIFRFSKDGTEMYFKLNLANIENVIMAHIHLAETPGGNGPPVIWLYPEGPPPQLIPGRFNGTISERTVTADDLVGPLAGQNLDELRSAIKNNLTYVNVHTSQFPGGEIRGQIK